METKQKQQLRNCVNIVVVVFFSIVDGPKNEGKMFQKCLFISSLKMYLFVAKAALL